AAGAGFGVAALVQGKGWLYLWLPAITLSLLTLYFALARSAATTSLRPARFLRAAAVLGFSAWLGGYAVRWAYVTRAARSGARAGTGGGRDRSLARHRLSRGRRGRWAVVVPPRVHLAARRPAPRGGRTGPGADRGGSGGLDLPAWCAPDGGRGPHQGSAAAAL